MAAKNNKKAKEKERRKTLHGVGPSLGISVVLESDAPADDRVVFDMVHVVEITGKGAILQASLLFEEEEIVTLQLTFGASEAHCVEARVLSVSAGQPAKMRVKFLEPSADVKQALVEYCESIR